MRYKIVCTLLISMSSFYALGQSLNNLLEKAHSNNPELKSLQLQYEAALQKAPQVSQLADPTVGLTLPVLRPETRLGGQVFTLSASQMFPWMGTLKAKEAIALSDAKSRLEEVERAKLEIDFDIKVSYEELYHIFAKKRILSSTLRVYETLERVSLARVEAGQAIASDVLKIKLQIEETKNLIELLESSVNTHNARINSLTNEAQSYSIQIDTSTREFAPMLFDLEEAKRKIEAGHPLFRQVNQEINTSQRRIELNEYNKKPALGLGLDYSWVAARSDANPMNNGRDILMPKIMVSLPINRNKYSARKKEEVLIQEAFAFKKESISNAMMSDFLSFKSDYDNAKLMYDLSNKQLEISESAFEILLTHYSSEGQKFDELMNTLKEMDRFKLARLDAIKHSYLARFRTERLTAF